MKYYRIDSVLDFRRMEFTSFHVQERRWGLWRTRAVYYNRSEAFMRLDSLNQAELRKRERYWVSLVFRFRDAFSRRLL